MTCKNCNGEMPEGALFCPTCGQKHEAEPVAPVENVSENSAEPVAEEPIAEETAAAEAVTNSTYMNFGPTEESVEKPKKKGKGKMIAGIVAAIVAVVAIGVGITAHAQIGNFVRKTFSSPEAYYQYVEKKNRDEEMETFREHYDSMLEESSAENVGQKVSYKLELGQSIKTLFAMTGTDLSTLESVQLNVSGKKKGDVVTGQITGGINEKDVVSLNMYLDSVNKEGYVQIPEVSETYLELNNALNSEEMSGALSDMTKMYSMGGYFPKTEEIETMAETYTDLFIDEMDSVKKSGTELEAAGVKAAYTDLEVTCKGKKMANIVVDVMTTMKDDKTLKGIIERIDKEAYTEFNTGLAEQIEEAKSSIDEVTDESLEAVMNVYVDGKGNIVGRMLTAKTEDSKELKITYIQPEDGSDVGMTISVEYDGVTYFTLSGKGTRKGGKLSGEYKVSMDDSLNPDTDTISTMKDFITIKVENLDEDTLEKDGVMNGTVTISTNAIAQISAYAIQLDAKGDKDKTTQTLSVMSGSDKLVSLIMTSEKGDVPEISKPAEGSSVCDVMDETALANYASEFNVETFLAGIKEKSGVDLSSIASLLEGMGGSDDVYAPEDYDTEDYSADDSSTEDLDQFDYSADTESGTEGTDLNSEDIISDLGL